MGAGEFMVRALPRSFVMVIECQHLTLPVMAGQDVEGITVSTLGQVRQKPVVIREDIILFRIKAEAQTIRHFLCFRVVHVFRLSGFG
jgi:hypothetical protein